MRILERIWAAVAPPPQPLGMLATLNPAEEAGLLDTLRRGVRYRKCTEKRRAGIAVSTARSPLRGTARTEMRLARGPVKPIQSAAGAARSWPASRATTARAVLAPWPPAC